MATHDYIISNASGAAVRADLNNALAAIASNNSSATEPTTTYAYQWWADTGSSPTVMKLRNAANSAWVTLFQLDGEWTVVPFENGSAAAPSIYFKDSGTDTGIYSPGVDQVAITTGGTSRLYVGSSGSVGIGSTSPARQLTLYNSTAPVLQLVNSTTGDTTNDGCLLYESGTNFIIENQEAGQIKLFNNGLQRAAIDASGRLLVGTATEQGVTRLQVQGTSSDANGQGAIFLRRGLANASIGAGNGLGNIDFGNQDGGVGVRIEAEGDAQWGSSDYPGRLVFKTCPDGSATLTERFRIDSNGYLRAVGTSGTARVIPHVDNVGYVGQSSERWQAIYAVNGTIQTSDRRQKTDITEALLGSDFIKTLKPVSYKWIEGGKEPTGEIDENGDQVFTSIPGQRTHWGFIAQDVKEAVDAAGVDFGGWLLDDKDDPNSQQALRYDQFIAPLTKALQEALAEIDVLKSKVAALESA